MGMFEQFKDMKETVAAAPGVVDEAQKMAANAQQMAAAQQAQAGAFGMPAAPTAASTAATAVGPDFEPVAGVSLDLYAEISKGLAAYDYDGVDERRPHHARRAPRDAGGHAAAAGVAFAGVPFSQLARLVPGATLRVRADPSDSSKVAADWAAPV